MQALQRKVVGTGSCGGGMVGAESSTLQSDATHLTILPPEQQQQHHLYHPDDNDDDDDLHNLQHVQHSRHVHHYR